MNHRLIKNLIMFAALAAAGPALAERSVISGQFTGDEPLGLRLNQECGETGGLAYQIVGPISTDVSGEYKVQDSGNTFFSQDTVVTIYEGMPDVNNLGRNQVGVADDNDLVDLVAGTEYYVFVQPWCSLSDFNNGVWGQHFNGPGLVSGAQTVQAEDWWGGEWTASDPTAEIPHPFADCPATPYDVSGPHRFDRTAVYYISTTSGYDEQYMLINVYDKPFNPDAPADNRFLAFFGGPIFLEKDKDYYFVVTSDCNPNTGEWYFVMWPPAPFSLNEGLAGTYFDPATDGHGILLDVSPIQDNFVFGAWFTWESGSATQSDADRPQTVGDQSQRWLTMIGTYEEDANAVDLTFLSATGGTFTTPATDNGIPAGTGRLEMEDCQSGVLTFDLDSGESGTRVMSRGLLIGNLRYCYDLAAAPAPLTAW